MNDVSMQAPTELDTLRSTRDVYENQKDVG
jgi:hypothetical protein